MRRALIALGIAEIADVLSTAYASGHGGVEGNPFLAAVLAVGGIAALFAVKSFIWAVVCYVAMIRPERLVRAAVIVGATLTAFVAVNNLTVGGS